MQTNKTTKVPWRPPEKGFEVALNISSTAHTPEEVSSSVGIQPTEARYAKDEVRKYHTWRLSADSSLRTIQEQIDDVMGRVQSHASRFASLENSDVYLTLYVYPETFEKYHHTHPSFDLDKKWIDLLHQMHATFVLD